jgi:uncharacterized protein (TIGR03083 family)
VDAQLHALRQSVQRLRILVAPLDDAQLQSQAYPSKWTVADVLSHIGSGAQIMQRRIDDSSRGEPTPDDFAPQVWDTWNAKSPRAKADDALAADQALVDRIDAMTDEERARFAFAIGPVEFDITGFVGLRVNEHVMHTWDVEVVGKPTATLARDGVELVVDNLGLIARFTGKPTGNERTIVIHTTDPARDFTVALTPEGVTFAPGGSGIPDVTIPAEAFARLVYGRLDPDHTPAIDGDPTVLDELRRVFPGP